ncbi:MAG TPA: lipopolysaccharide biosynthesis protein [Vicinamibacterales bacterium]|nr:lipopolysaccharide biosynthesis protein [Vicinamibacterales bacterium]
MAAQGEQPPGDAGPPAEGTSEQAPKTAWSVRSLIVSGFAWSVGTGVAVQLSRIVFAVALARLLTPREYGLATMALVVSALVSTLTDLSLGVGLVQRSTITEEDRSTVFWTNGAIGAGLSAASLALAGPIALFYGEPEVRPLFAALSLSFLIGSLGATHAALLHREMDFRAISIRVGASTIVGGIVGVVVAAAGWGAWALIVQQLSVAAISSVLLWTAVPWRPRLLYSIASLRDLGSFGGVVFGVRVSDYARMNGERLLVGRFLGSIPLGAYSVAFNILLSPVGRFLIAVMDTLFPVLSRLQDDPARLAAVWVRVNRLFAAAFVPALIGLAVVAPDFVVVVLGDKWIAVTPLLQILAVGVIAQVVSALGADVLKAVGRAGTLLRFSTVEAILFLGGTVVGLWWGIAGVAAAYAIVNVLTRTYFLWLAADSVGLPFRAFLQSLSGVSQASLALLAATIPARLFLLETAAPPWLRLALVVTLGVLVYVPVCLWRVPELRVEIDRLRRDAVGWRNAITLA